MKTVHEIITATVDAHRGSHDKHGIVRDTAAELVAKDALNKLKAEGFEIDERADRERLVAVVAALQHGCTVEPAYLYEDVNCEGWVWEDPDGKDLGEAIGVWDSIPAMPKGLLYQLMQDATWRS